MNLVYLHLEQGDHSRYWQSFKPVLDEVLDHNAIGLLLLEPRTNVLELSDPVPAQKRQCGMHYEAELWNTLSPEPLMTDGPLGALSEREQEVLAKVSTGTSNKHIARDFALSLPTVKRHIANILDKLDCPSRGHAADLYRRAKPAD